MWQALLAALLAEEPETEEERAAIEAAQADMRAGRRWHSAEEIHALIDDLPSE